MQVALAGVAQWIEHQPTDHLDPVRSQAWVAG